MAIKIGISLHSRLTDIEAGNAPTNNAPQAHDGVGTDFPLFLYSPASP